MSDPKIDAWKPRGAIYIWHYEGFPKNFPGYHLTADQQGCIFLLGLFERFRGTHYPAHKKFPLLPPTPNHLAIPNCPKAAIPARLAEFRFQRDFPNDYWSMSEADGMVAIETGATGLSALERGILDILLGKGDWFTGQGNHCLWFWWHPPFGPGGKDLRIP